ncbi:MAG: hypothetical protein ACD_75C00704G0003 [uncultured bacterium]|nr:MAG: hypothetical protein ACD_75C00704G0003 [uncultured bacterium]
MAADHRHTWLGNVAGAAEDGANGPIYGIGMLIVAPQAFQTVLVEEHGGEVGLRIEVDGKRFDAMVCKHPCQMIDQRGLAHPTLIVEKGNRFQIDLPNILTNTECSSNSNSAGGLPFCARSACALCTP